MQDGQRKIGIPKPNHTDRPSAGEEVGQSSHDKWKSSQLVKTTPQMTRFRDVQQAILMATVRIDDDKIKSDYNVKKTWSYVCVVKPNDKTSDTNDNVTTKTNTVHMKRDT